MMDKAKQLNWPEGFGIGNGTKPSAFVSQFFADDTLIFCGAERSQVQHFNITLMIFDAMSALHTNMSVIYPVNLVLELDELAEIMCCNTSCLPTTYLRLLLGARYRSAEIWSGSVEKLGKRLASWQQQYLSFGGRKMLINNVLDGIPTYYISLIPIPTEVLQQLDSLYVFFPMGGQQQGPHSKSML